MWLLLVEMAMELLAGMRQAHTLRQAGRQVGKQTCRTMNLYIVYKICQIFCSLRYCIFPHHSRKIAFSCGYRAGIKPKGRNEKRQFCICCTLRRSWKVGKCNFCFFCIDCIIIDCIFISTPSNEDTFILSRSKSFRQMGFCSICTIAS